MSSSANPLNIISKLHAGNCDLPFWSRLLTYVQVSSLSWSIGISILGSFHSHVYQVLDEAVVLTGMARSVRVIRSRSLEAIPFIRGSSVGNAHDH